MVYYGTENTELIVFHGAGDPNDTHFIGMIKHADSRSFSVRSCCDSDWCYEFHMNNNSDYERVKFNIMETAFDCEDMDELLDALSEIFEDGFANILISNDCDCDGNCGDECQCHTKENNITYLN
jgi:hypothetical protein